MDHGLAGGSAIQKLALVLAVCALGAGGYAGHSQMEFRKLGRALAADIATYERQRWERPVLRGRPLEGNSADLLLAQVAMLPDLAPAVRGAIAKQLFAVQPPTAEAKLLLSKHRVALAKLRAATRSRYSITRVNLRSGSDIAVPDYNKVMDAALLVLATGLTYDAKECLLLGADVVRIGQDLVPGAPLEASSVAMRMTSVAVPLMTKCARDADGPTLDTAARELHLLATHPPSPGGGIELEDIAARIELYQQGTLIDQHGDDSPIDRLLARRVLLDVFPYFDEPSRWRSISPLQYPASLETWKREHDHRSRAAYPEVARGSAGGGGGGVDDMRGQALVRALAVGFATLAQRHKHGTLPARPTGIDDPQLRDPISGEPLRFAVTEDEDETELAIWSVGENMIDDGGSGDWAQQAPLDVVVRFGL